MNQLLAAAAELHTPSLLVGLFLAAVPLSLLWLMSHARQSRRLLGLSIRLEQATRNIHRREEDIARLREERNREQTRNRQYAETIAGLQAEQESGRQLMREREELLRITRSRMEQDFKLLAGEVLSKQGAVLGERHAAGLRGLLDPMREQLHDFRKRVEDVYDREARDHAALLREIDLLRKLNQQLSSDALNLSKALRGDSKTQGQWGEMILEKLLEDSGLRKGDEFESQPSFNDEGGERRRPDVIVHLPRRRDIVIDAKVSLKAWVSACSEQDDAIRQQLLNRHLQSVENHIKILSSKEYHRLPGIDTVDFVLLFLPNEGAFQAAISMRPEILTQAMKKKVILAGPSTLLAVLRTIHHLWRVDEQGRNGLAIAKQAGNLYDKFVGFSEAFEEIGSRLDQSRQSWETARKRLVSGRGNLIDRVESLKRLGIQPEKTIPPSLRNNADNQAS